MLHEPDTGSRSVDVVFSSTKGVCFSADIIAISDDAQHSRNPVKLLEKAVNHAVRERRIQKGRFAIQVYEKQPAPNRFHNRKRELLCPSSKDIASFISGVAFSTMIVGVESAPDVQQSTRFIEAGKHDFSIHYEPGKGSGAFLSSYPLYTSTTAKDDNPLFNALKSKAVHLRKANAPDPRGIIVCDRGAQVLNEMSNWSTFSMHEVVDEFFVRIVQSPLS